MRPRIAFTVPTSRLEFGYWNLEFLDRNESFTENEALPLDLRNCDRGPDRTRGLVYVDKILP